MNKKVYDFLIDMVSIEMCPVNSKFGVELNSDACDIHQDCKSCWREAIEKYEEKLNEEELNKNERE